MEKRNLRKERIGVVTSDKMEKSLNTVSSLRKLPVLLLTTKTTIVMLVIPFVSWKHVL